MRIVPMTPFALVAGLAVSDFNLADKLEARARASTMVMHREIGGMLTSR